MNPLLILTIASSTKKQVYFVLLMLLIILYLPVMAVFALGTSALSFLSGSSGSASAIAISPQSQGLYEGAAIAGDYYAWGNCTYWVFALRLQANEPIPTSWGNAATWAFYAQIDGYLVDHTPATNAIMQISDVDGGLGHVAYVTAVDPTSGAWTVSEMNVEGLDVIDTRTYPASAAVGFNFIHDKVNTP